MPPIATDNAPYEPINDDSRTIPSPRLVLVAVLAEAVKAASVAGDLKTSQVASRALHELLGGGADDVDTAAVERPGCPFRTKLLGPPFHIKSMPRCSHLHVKFLDQRARGLDSPFAPSKKTACCRASLGTRSSQTVRASVRSRVR